MTENGKPNNEKLTAVIEFAKRHKVALLAGALFIATVVGAFALISRTMDVIDDGAERIITIAQIENAWSETPCVTVPANDPERLAFFADDQFVARYAHALLVEPSDSSVPAIDLAIQARLAANDKACGITTTTLPNT